VPTYEYACSKCKGSYELREGFDAPTTHACQECRRGTAKRVLYAPPVVFKGSGWYATDSRNSRSARVESDTGSDTSTDSTPAASETKTETKVKTEAKTEPAAAG